MIRFDRTGKYRKVKERSTLPEMTDESGKAYRAKLVALGLITPSSQVYAPNERPFMDRDLFERMKRRYIQTGLIVPESA